MSLPCSKASFPSLLLPDPICQSLFILISQQPLSAKSLLQHLDQVLGMVNYWAFPKQIMSLHAFKHVVQSSRNVFYNLDIYYLFDLDYPPTCMPRVAAICTFFFISVVGSFP